MNMDRLTKNEKLKHNGGYGLRMWYKDYASEEVKEVITNINEAIDKLSKLEDIEEELGCPLDVVFKALKDGIYQEDGGRRKLPFIEYNSGTNKFYFGFGTYCNVEDYKKTWWLREDKSE